MIQSQFYSLCSYDEGLAVQKRALERLKSDSPKDRDLLGFVMGFEHNAVVTLGVRGAVGIDVQADQDLLRRQGVELRRVDRGGQATVHSPGQLVIYPCLHLKRLGVSPRHFVSLMERVTERLLISMGLDAIERRCEPGLYVHGKKIAAFGFRISRGLTSHGVAINVRNDLGLFGLIRTCGVSQQPVTSLYEQHVMDGVDKVFHRWVEMLERELFEIELGASRKTIGLHQRAGDTGAHVQSC